MDHQEQVEIVRRLLRTQGSGARAVGFEDSEEGRRRPSKVIFIFATREGAVCGGCGKYHAETFVRGERGASLAGSFHDGDPQSHRADNGASSYEWSSFNHAASARSWGRTVSLAYYERTTLRLTRAPLSPTFTTR
jgi:hypothetical protein